MERVLFIGSKAIGISVLKEMHRLAPEALVAVMTIDDAADARSVLGEFRAFAAGTGIPLHVAGSRKQSESLIAQISPALCVVVGWYWLIGGPALASVPRGFIGIHNSLLPAYRGGAPLVWTMINGEKEAGFSLFTLTEGMDEGPVWASGSVLIEAADHVADVLRKLEIKTLQVFRETYPRILSGDCAPRVQDHSLATYCAQRTSADGLIDWHQPARGVYDFVRAQSDPYPGAFTRAGGKVVRIWRASLFPRPYSGTPGQVVQITADGVIVACGDHHAIVLHEIEWAGQRGAAADLIKTCATRFDR